MSENQYPHKVTNFIDSNGVDLGKKLVSKEYLISVYPGILDKLGLTPQLLSWGRNINGALGVSNSNSGFSTNIPTLIPNSGYTWGKVSSSTHSIAIKNDDTLWTWGCNNFGELGLGHNIQINSPTQVGIQSNWRMVEGGENYTVGLINSGRIFSWGRNENGQLGLGQPTGFTTNSPTQVGITTTWRYINVGPAHFVGIQTDGSLWACGRNNNGQLGISNNTTPINVPTKVGADVNWNQISCGSLHTIGIKLDGTIWAWGSNSWGELGFSGLSTNRPTQIGSDVNWRQVSCGENYSLAIKNDGTLWSWGRNNNGTLGLGVGIGSTNMPTKVGNSSNWKKVYAYKLNCFGLKSDGTLWAWGQNNDGILGLGDSNIKYTPNIIGSITNWKQVGVGNTHTLAIRTLDFI